MEKTELVEALKLLTKFVSSLKEDEFHTWISGQSKLTLLGPDDQPAARTRSARRKADNPPPDFTSVINSLHQCASEEEARALLGSSALTKTKDLLLALGQQLNANVKKSQNKGDMLETIVKHTVGRRLQAEAITRVTSE